MRTKITKASLGLPELSRFLAVQPDKPKICYRGRLANQKQHAEMRARLKTEAAAHKGIYWAPRVLIDLYSQVDSRFSTSLGTGLQAYSHIYQVTHNKSMKSRTYHLFMGIASTTMFAVSVITPMFSCLVRDTNSIIRYSTIVVQEAQNKTLDENKLLVNMTKIAIRIASLYAFVNPQIFITVQVLKAAESGLGAAAKRYTSEKLTIETGLLALPFITRTAKIAKTLLS